MSTGARPAASAASSSVALRPGSAEGSAYPMLGTQPSASRPVNRSIRGL